MQQDQFKHIGELVESLGRKDFDERFFRFYDEVLGITYCTVFEFKKFEHARIIMALSTNTEVDKSAKSLAYDYVNGFFQEDPHLIALMSTEKMEHPEWKTGDPQKIEDTEYRTKFYDNPELFHEMVLSYKDKRHSLIATLYRDKKQGPFSSAEKKRASSYVDLSLKLLNKHIDLLNFSPENDKKDNRTSYQRVYELLMKQDVLSPREAEICAMILVGYTTLGISLNLEISINTVATHRKRAYRKLGIATQNELFCKCFEVWDENLPADKADIEE
jgi:DNA-binding CsgD family transcriptional regulator